MKRNWWEKAEKLKYEWNENTSLITIEVKCVLQKGCRNQSEFSLINRLIHKSLTFIYAPRSNKGMEHLYSMKCKNKVPLYDLLLEMLDAHRVHRPDRPAESWSQADGEPPFTSRNSSSGSSGGGSSAASSSSGPRASHECLSRTPTGPGVLQYGGSRSDCTHILWDRAQGATSEGQKSFLLMMCVVQNERGFRKQG